jgi:hypothetical protein
MIGLRLFLPESWTSAPDRMAKARVPENGRAARTKPEIALAEIDRIRAAGVRFATVLADAGYGLSAPFRQGLDARGLKWAVGILKQQKVYPSHVRLMFPIAGRGRPRKRHIPDPLSAPAEDVLTTAKWRRVSWRKGTKGPLAASFAAVRVRIADGPPQSIHEKGMQHMPGEEAWLVGERRASGERKYDLSNLPPDANLKTLAAAIKARWVCEQAHQQLQEELGLDHFEGRSWHGLHRHTLMTMIAYGLPAKPPPRRGERGKKESAKGRPSRRCPRSGAPCSPFLLARRHIDVPIAGEPSQDASNKSAKVVLVRSATTKRWQKGRDLAGSGIWQVRPGRNLAVGRITERARRGAICAKRRRPRRPAHPTSLNKKRLSERSRASETNALPRNRHARR